MKFILFDVGNGRYALDVTNIISIERIKSVTQIAGMPSYVNGISEIRDNLTTILDLNKILFVNDRRVSSEFIELIVMHHESVYYGLIVDGVTDVIDLNIEDIQKLENKSITNKPFLNGVVTINNELVIVVDGKKLLKNISLVPIN